MAYDADDYFGTGTWYCPEPASFDTRTGLGGDGFYIYDDIATGVGFYGALTTVFGYFGEGYKRSLDNGHSSKRRRQQREFTNIIMLYNTAVINRTTIVRL